MKTRRLQRTGGSSHSITIPKKWVDRLKLEDKSELIVDSTHATVLKIFPNIKQKSEIISEIDASELSPIKIIREVIANYLSGVDQLTIANLGIEKSQNKKLRSTYSSLIGFEIIEESANKIVLQNIFDNTRFPISVNIKRMFVMVTSMYKDTLIALTSSDKLLAKNIVKRELEVDKFYHAVTRQFYVSHRNDHEISEIGLNPVDLYYYGLISRQLERIADHCVKICARIEKDSYNPQIFSAVESPGQHIYKLLKDSQTMVKEISKTDAHLILNRSEQIRKEIDKIQESNSQPETIFNTVFDSLDRISSYLTNIAEATIDQSLFNK